MTIIQWDGYNNVYTFMGWELITEKSSLQYKLREEAATQGVKSYDSEGFGKIRGYYVIACSPIYGGIGTYIDWTLADGTVLHTIIGDLKYINDDNYRVLNPTLAGHFYGTNSICVVEFVVDCNTWYTANCRVNNHPNPGNPSCKPEWAGRIQSYEVIGNWWGNNPDPANPTEPGGGEDNPGVIINPGDTHLETVSGTGNVAIVRAKKRVVNTIREVSYVAAKHADGYVYFNDSNFYRVSENTPLQILNTNAHSWSYSKNLFDITVSEFEINGLTALLFGAGSWPVPTVPVAPGEPGSTNPIGQGIEAAVTWAIDIANDPGHGYDQIHRTGPDYDCSSLVYTAFREAGGFSLLPAYPGNTSTMVDHFTKAGFEFLAKAGNTVQELQRGDILFWNKTLGGKIHGHTVIYIGNQQVVAARRNEKHSTTGGQSGDQDGEEISVHNYYVPKNKYTSAWDGIIRYTRPLFGSF